MIEKVIFTIDGVEVTANKGDTIIKAALEQGIYIPHLCYHPDLKPFGGCRLCVVEIEGRGLTISCKALVEEGINVVTENPEISKMRRVAAELLIVNHYTDCLQCAKNTECKLQEIAARIGIEEGRLQRLKRGTRNISIDYSNPFFIRDHNKCVLCGICVRTCDEIQGISSIDFTFRGHETKVSTFKDKPILESTCESCGECVVRCPVGSLVPKEVHKPSYEVKTICPYCGCGCGIHLGVRAGRVVGVQGDRESPVNQGELCVKGRFGYTFINHPDRLTTPLIRRNGRLEEASWEEALDLVASSFQEVQEKYGPESLGGLSSARVTNEDNYLFQKLLRSIGSNSVDCCARLCHAATVVGLATTTGSGAMTNPISDIEECKTILVVGSNPSSNHPIVNYRIRRAVKKGSRLIVIDPLRIPLAEIADVYLQHKAGTDVALFNGMMAVILREGLVDRNFIAQRTNGFEYLQEFIMERYSLDSVSEITGVPVKDIEQAARLYATASSASIFYCMGVTQHTCGTENVLALINLAMATGNFGKPHTGVNPLRGQNNVQGACDMGCLPHVLPGYQPLHSDCTTYWQRLACKEDEGAAELITALEFDFYGKSPQAVPAGKVSDHIRTKFSKAWGVELSDIPGRTINDMFHPNPGRWCKALYIMGENPLISSPDLQHVREAIESLDFLVVQDIFLTEVAQMADVVLPAASFAEKEGTFTNTERRVQRIHRAIQPVGQSKPDWEIIQAIAQKLNLPWKYQSPKEIWDEMRQLTPHYFGGMSYERLEEQGLQWPCPTEEHPGTLIMHHKSWCGEENRFSRGIGQFSTVDYRPLATERPDADYPFVLTTARKLYQYHTRSMTGRVEGLNELLNEERLQINPMDAKKLRINTEDRVRVTSARGSVETSVEITDLVPVGVVSMSFHFAKSAANVLTNPAVCSMSVTAELKVSTVNIEKIEKRGVPK